MIADNTDNKLNIDKIINILDEINSELTSPNAGKHRYNYRKIRLLQNRLLEAYAKSIIMDQD